MADRSDEVEWRAIDVRVDVLRADAENRDDAEAVREPVLPKLAFAMLHALKRGGRSYHAV